MTTAVRYEYDRIPYLVAYQNDSGVRDVYGGVAELVVLESYLLRPKDKPVEGKQVIVVELERANLFVLDSFDPKNTVGGILGEAQLKWLAKALDDRKTKPAVVCVHHPLQFDVPKSVKSNGIADTTDFWPVLKDRPQVKAFVFGHTHTWKLAERDGVHLINLPAIGYPFAKGEVTGWVDATFTEKGIEGVQAALAAAQTLGYVWTTDALGYSVRYAIRIRQPDGATRIIVATDRKLDLAGPRGSAAKPADPKADDYPFTLIELRLKGRGTGEGRTSLTSKIAADAAAKAIALESYEKATVVLKDVKEESGR